MSEQTIDLTPAGCQTPEGIARVNAALRAVDNANAECARLLEYLVTDDLPASPAGMWATYLDYRDDIGAALTVRRNANEEFRRALCGAPSMATQSDAALRAALAASPGAQ